MESARGLGANTGRRENVSGNGNTSIKALIYARISLDKTGEALGVERQETECRRLCDQRGYELQQVIAENSVSATKGERPGYTQLLSLIERRAVDVVVVYKLDRLLRKVTELEHLIDLTEQTGVQFVTVQGDLDLTTSSGRLVGRLLASVARAEIETMSERRRFANAQKAAQGRIYGTGRCYGYEPDGMTIREAEAAILREMARRVIAGHSYTDVARWANQQGHPTAKGNSWRPITVRNRLLNKRYIAVREYNGVEYPGVWPPIFDRETWDRLQLTVRLRAEKVPFIPRPRSYLLTGLAFCGKCGHSMIGSTVSDSSKRRTYVCANVTGSRHLTRNADALEHFITELVFYRLDSPALAQYLDTNKREDSYLAELLRQREDQKRRLDSLIDDYATGLLNQDQLARAKATGEAALKELEQDIDRLSRERAGFSALPLNETIRQAWANNESLKWRQSLLKLLIKRIVVLPGQSMPWYEMNGTRRRFAPSLIQMEWLA